LFSKFSPARRSWPGRPMAGLSAGKAGPPMSRGSACALPTINRIAHQPEWKAGPPGGRGRLRFYDFAGPGALTCLHISSQKTSHTIPRSTPPKGAFGRVAPPEAAGPGWFPPPRERPAGGPSAWKRNFSPMAEFSCCSCWAAQRGRRRGPARLENGIRRTAPARGLFLSDHSGPNANQPGREGPRPSAASMRRPGRFPCAGRDHQAMGPIVGAYSGGAGRHRAGPWPLPGPVMSICPENRLYWHPPGDRI